MEIVSESTFQTLFLSHTLSKQEKKIHPYTPLTLSLDCKPFLFVSTLLKLYHDRQKAQLK